MRFRLKHIYILFFFILTIWLFSFCNNNTNDTLTTPYLNLEDNVQYVGMATCRSCHNNVYETFIQTGMGQSFRHAVREKSDAQFGDHAVIYDTLNNLYYYPFLKNDTTFYVLEYRLENDDTTHKRLEKVDYIVGSGQHTNSHIIDINGYVYQAPVTWYTQEKRWDLAPGFRENNSRFDRWLTEECITCHNHFPKQIKGSLNKFSDMPTGIECERCHGPGEIHVKEKLAGNIVDTSLSIDYTIVNPRDLPRDLQMDICQRCHLQGVAVTEPGKTFFDFKPGTKLNETINVFLPRFTDSHDKFIMASQADRLRLSKCFKNTEELTCLTCHHPHHSVEVTPKKQFNQACKNCHLQKTCSLAISEREENGDDCASCHMPKSGSIDIPHIRITDHFISVHEPKTADRFQKKSFLGIEILTKDDPTPLDMARGYLAMHDKYLAAPVMLDSAWHYLQLSQAQSDQLLPVQIHYYFLRQDFDKLIEISVNIADNQPLGAWSSYRIGEAFFQNGDYENAFTYFNSAVNELPLHLDFLEKKGIVLISLKKLEEAKKLFEEVLSENSKRPISLCNLGFVYVLSGNIKEGEKWYDKAIALDPDYEQALVNKAAILLLKKKKKEAKELLERVLRINPENQQAIIGMGRMMNGGR